MAGPVDQHVIRMALTAPDLVPKYSDLLVPTLRAVIDIGGSGTIEEIVERVIQNEGFSEEQQSVAQGDTGRTALEYRLAWARSYLKGMGLLDNSARGVWSITEAGRTADAAEVQKRYTVFIAARNKIQAERRRQKGETDGDSDGQDLPDDETDWKTELLTAVGEMEPAGFERLAQRLLREAGFVSVNVTGKSGDGGIDGIGVYRLSLVSFPVFFQCKKYTGSVRARDVRDFRGAMHGRGDKGLLITTGAFTADAKDEATREGATPIDLIDGDRLCDLLKQYELGVRTATRTIEDVSVLREFFADV